MVSHQIISFALEALEKQAGIVANWTPAGQLHVDGKVQFKYNNEHHMLFAVVKKELRNHQLDQLEKLKLHYAPLLVIAEYIFPKIKEELRSRGICYLETSGNIYLKEKNIFLLVEGQKAESLSATKRGRAFTKKGLELVFHFLLDPALVNLTYREIADKTKIGFGNINFIMTDLKTQGYLTRINKNNYSLHNKKDLLEKWMAGYEERLKPSLYLGAFEFVKEEALNWKLINLDKGLTCWGGEPAGYLLTKFLLPGEMTLYTTEKRIELVKKYRMLADNGGKTKVYRKFWTDIHNETSNYAPPLLIYADLMNTGNRRCMDTAQRIYDKYLQDQF